jgi:hypothetical protein
MMAVSYTFAAASAGKMLFYFVGGHENSSGPMSTRKEFDAKKQPRRLAVQNPPLAVEGHVEVKHEPPISQSYLAIFHLGIKVS